MVGVRGVQLGYMSTNGVTLHVATAGPEDGPLVVLLHGFPELWWAWRRYIPALARSEEHTSELQSHEPYLVCRLLLEKKKCSYHG